MQNKDKPGTGATWKNESTNPQAPAYKGHFFAHRDIKEGEKIDLALFANDSQNERAPAYNVRVQNPWVQGEQRERKVEQVRKIVQQDTGEDFDDEIPF